MLGTGSITTLLGKRGTGKTKLAVEAMRQVCHAEAVRRLTPRADGVFDAPPNLPDIGGVPWVPALYLTAVDMFLLLRQAFRDEGVSEREMILAVCRPRLLVLDEIQERGQSDWEDRMLTHIIDRRYYDETDTILIGNLRPEALQEQLGASIVSRMQENGAVIPCQWESFRTPSGSFALKGAR